jgi:GGDEF domain-containing protein
MVDSLLTIDSHVALYPRSMSQRSREISFGGDGTFDLLTNAYTPRFFYVHLDREIALASRAESQNRIYPLTLISFRLPFDNTPPSSRRDKQKRNHDQWEEQIFISYEQSLATIGRTLEKSMREGDVLARIYECGFVILTRNQREGGSGMILRIEKLLPEKVEIFLIERKKDENRHSLISRLDAQYFNLSKLVDN